MKQPIPTIILTGGGSGGHITPLLSLAHEIKAQSPQARVIFIGHKTDDISGFKHDFDKVFYINAGKFRRYNDLSFWQRMTKLKTLLMNIRDFFRVIASTFTAYRILSKTHPDVMFSKGSFVSVTVGIAARFKRIPIVTHDSDTIGGLANHIIGRWAVVRTSGMPTDEPGFRYVGIPLSKNIKQVSPNQQRDYKHEIGLPTSSTVLLLTGGGNGSVHLNDLLLEAAPLLLSANPNLYIIHIAGDKHLQAVKDGYKKILPEADLSRVHTFGFVNDLYKYSGAADLIISRAGATTIAEFAVQAKACIIIPSPYLTGGHQLTNAKVLAEAKAAVVLDEDTTADTLASSTQDLLEKDKQREDLAENLHALAKTDADQTLAKIILETAG